MLPECFMNGDVFVRKMFLAVGDDKSVYPKKLGHTSLTKGSDCSSFALLKMLPCLYPLRGKL